MKLNFLRNILKKSRIDYFIIWGHGLQHKDEIIEIIRNSGFLDIVSIIYHQPISIEQLVNTVYSYDYAPLEHLKGKTQYLLKCPKNCLFIFVRNTNVEETFIGEGEYRHIECKNIRIIKDTIRNQFNPYINEKRTEHHVIHASDNEFQSDFILKYLGFPQGVSLYSNQPNKVISAPYHLGSFSSFELRKVRAGDIYSNIITGPRDHFTTQLCSLEETPHYKGLTIDEKYYKEYIDKYQGFFLTDFYSYEKYKELAKRFNYKQYLSDTNYILTREFEAGRFLLLDGTHRACILRSQKLDEFIVSIIRNEIQG